MLYPINKINEYILSDNKYFLDETGVIYFKNNYNQLRPFKPFGDGKRGYIKVKLYDINVKPLTLSVHRLVYTVINKLNYSTPGLEVNHKDGNKLNNNINNLELITPKENVRHSIINKLSESRAHQITIPILNKIQKLIEDGLTNREISIKTNYSQKVIKQIRDKTHTLLK